MKTWVAGRPDMAWGGVSGEVDIKNAEKAIEEIKKCVGKENKMNLKEYLTEKVHDRFNDILNSQTKSSQYPDLQEDIAENRAFEDIFNNSELLEELNDVQVLEVIGILKEYFKGKL